MKTQQQFLNVTIHNGLNIAKKFGNSIRSFFFFIFFILLIIQGYGQQKRESAGGVTAFYESLKQPPKANAKLLAPLKKTVKVNAGENVLLKIESNRQTEAGEIFIGKAEQNKQSFAFFTFKDGAVKGKVILPDQKKAYSYTSENGNVWVVPEDIDKAMCVEYQQVQASSSSAHSAQAPLPGSPAYNLQSLPGATAVVMLDFDGHNATGSFWGNIIVQPAQVSESDIMEAWKVVSEDFSTYELNVTTSETVYQAAPANRRMRCVITPTTDAAPGSGGVAFIGSFTTGGDLAPCWVFNGALSNGGGGKLSGETASHEIGHTVGLFHDGRELPSGHEEYYGGQGIWAPIMGVAYSAQLSQWSIGEYQYANNKQDDIQIIGTTNGFGFKADETGNTPATARQLIYSASGNVSAATNKGIIGNRTDLDVFYFDSPGGLASLRVGGTSIFTDLDVGLTLTNSVGTVVATANPADSLSATLLVTLAAGRYYLTVDGVGAGDPFTNGYSDYSCIGEYTISGDITTVIQCSLDEPVPAASSFALKNDYWDNSSGSFVTNECNALKIVHRDYGQNQLWAVRLGSSFHVVSGQIYNIRIDFKDFAALGISGIEVGFATELLSYASQPTLSGSTVSFPAGFSGCSFLTKSVNLTAVATGQVFLAFKLKWSTQPTLKTYTYIKNILVCPGAGSASLAALPGAGTAVSKNAAPEASCALEQPNPSAPSFVLRNEYWDNSSGSYVSNECDALKIVQRNYGKNELWVVGLGKPFQVVSGQTYNIRMDFLDFGALGVSGIEIGFATDLLSYASQPTLSGSTVNFPAGYSSCSFLTKSVNLTAVYTGQVFLAFKLKWPNQPTVQVSTFIKNLTVCPGAGSTSKIAFTEGGTSVEAGAALQAMTISPNPAETDFNANPKRDVALLSVSDMQGRQLYTREHIEKDSYVKFGESFNQGLYIVSIRYVDGTHESFKIIKTK